MPLAKSELCVMMESLWLSGEFIMKKIIISCLVTAVLVTAFWCTMAGYFIGNYIVQFGLERGGEADNPKAPPRAYALLMPPESRQFTKPDEEHEVWKIRSDDGLLLQATHFYPEEDSNRWVIVAHGYGCTQQNSWYIASTYLSMGYHVLTPDLRASGDSEGKFLTMGYMESKDIEHWAAEIVRHYPEAKIALHGVSMGAAAVMLAAASGNLPENVVACIEDSGFTSAYHLLALRLEDSFGLPAFPAMNLLDWRCEHLAGFSLRHAAPIKVMDRVRMPILFIHGEKDTLVPPYMADLLYEACWSPKKEIFLAPDSIHGAASQTAHDAYYKKVVEFLEPCMRDEGMMQ